jgi:hypothetical protein
MFNTHTHKRAQACVRLARVNCVHTRINMRHATSVDLKMVPSNLERIRWIVCMDTRANTHARGEYTYTISRPCNLRWLVVCYHQIWREPVKRTHTYACCKHTGAHCSHTGVSTHVCDVNTQVWDVNTSAHIWCKGSRVWHTSVHCWHTDTHTHIVWMHNISCNLWWSHEGVHNN